MEIQETDKGIIVEVKVKPNSGAFGLSKKGGDLIIEVRSSASEGKANQEIIRELPRLLRCDVKILSGAKSRKKILLLEGVTESDIELVLDTR